VDVLPTLAKLAAVKLPKGMRLDGEDISDILLGESRPRATTLTWEWRFEVFGEVFHRSPMLAIREGNWKLLMNPDRSRVELYDIPHDPTELTNQAEKHPELVEKLAEKVLTWQKTLPKGPVDLGAGKNDYPWPKAKLPR
jgi:arylsulfatase A-like enzyme